MPKSRISFDLLPPIDIPLRQPPIPDDVDNADCGIGLRHVEHPLVVYIDRPDSTPPGTLFQLFWGSRAQPVAFNFLGEDDDGLTRIPFIVTQNRIQEFWADPVFARVIRPSGNPSETEPLRVRVNLRRPGGRDPDDQVPGHQGLVFELPPDVLLDGIDETRATQGVIVTFRYWENMAAYDRITLAWGSQTITRWVQRDEVGNDIQMIVDPTVIALAGNSDVLPVAFQVMGPTGNYPDEWARWSAAQLVDVHADSDRLDPPWVKFPVTERDIDLEQLAGRDVIISVHVGRADASAYSLLTLMWVGRDREGGSVPHTPSITIVAGSNRTYDFAIDHALVAAIAQGTAAVYYLLQGAGLPDKRSDNLHLRVMGDYIKWPAPIIDEAPAGHLDPNLPEATIRFPFQQSWPGDALLEVVFVAGGAEGTVEHRIGREVDDVPPTTGGYMLFTVHNAELKRFEGYSTDVYYVLTRRNITPGETPQESLRLKVQVGEPARELPQPIVQQAPDGLLNPDDISDYARVIAPFTGTLRGDWINMHWIGPNAHTSVMVQVGIDGTTTEHEILIDYITPNLDQEVTVFYTLIRGDEALRYSHTTTVRISHGVGHLFRPTVLEADPYGLALNLVKPIDGATVVVPHYTGMRLNDEITVYWEGAAGTVYESKTVLELGSQDIHIDNATVISSAGQSATIYYRVKSEFAVELSPPSDSLILDIQNPELVGLGSGSFPAGYYCTAPVTNVGVSESMPLGTVIMQTDAVGSMNYSYLAEQANRAFLNKMAQQPAQGSFEFPTGVPGVAARFIYLTGKGRTVRPGGVSGIYSGRYGWNGTMGQIEFVKVGKVATGSIEPGDLLLQVVGNTRFIVLTYSLLNKVTFTALP
jgi:hypothetical protein